MPTQKVAQVKEGGKPVFEVQDVRFIGSEGSNALFQIGSGRYRFTAPQP
jgi:hypothetical protein